MLSFKQLLEELKLTLQYHTKLNPKIWDNFLLNQKTNDHLLKEAYKFAEFSGEDQISDIVFTGSGANYNYTKYSDIDIHILCSDINHTSDYLYDKKTEWSNDHDLKLHGYPLEFYIQDDHEHFPKGQGVYSLLSKKWLVKPTHLNDIPVLHDPKTMIKLEYEIKTIKKLIKSGSLKDIKEYKDKLWRMRTSGLNKEGEFSIENVLYKELRNRKLLDKLNERLKYHENGKTKS